MAKGACVYFVHSSLCFEREHEKSLIGKKIMSTMKMYDKHIL